MNHAIVLRRIGFAFGGITAMVMIIAAGLVQAHSSGRMTLEDKPITAPAPKPLQSLASVEQPRLRR